jgi:uncharacterized protein (TIGR02145 family)
MHHAELKNHRIHSELGRGGMAIVYLAHDNKFDTIVAVKVLNKEFVHNENIRKRFIAEARKMFKMSHPNIIKVTDLIEDGDSVAFVMEYIEGETLKEYIDRKGKLSDEEIKIIFTQMLDAVGYVHEQNLVHRDIKPSNFMISAKGIVKLLDFGIAKNTDVNSSEYTITGTTQNMGTPMYMSPEQIKSTKDVTHQTDIYSLGVVLWQMVTGKKPYDLQTLSTFELQTKIVNEKLDKTHSIWDIQIQKASAKNLEERFQQCHAWLREMNYIFSVDSPAPIADDKTVLAKKVHEDATQIEQQTKNTEDINAQTVTIGGQVWTSKNLNVDKFRNGDPIPEARTDEEWKRAGEKQQPAWCYYDNDSNNGTKYGKLYNWFAVNDSRGIAPNGWHVPSDADWTILTDYLGGEKVAGTKMKSTRDWKNEGNGTNENGFSGLPGGIRYGSGTFEGVDGNGGWWSSAEASADNAWGRGFSCSRVSVGRSYNAKKSGFSVRCLRD